MSRRCESCGCFLKDESYEHNINGNFVCVNSNCYYKDFFVKGVPVKKCKADPFKNYKDVIEEARKNNGKNIEYLKDGVWKPESKTTCTVENLKRCILGGHKFRIRPVVKHFCEICKKEINEQDKEQSTTHHLDCWNKRAAMLWEIDAEFNKNGVKNIEYFDDLYVRWLPAINHSLNRIRDNIVNMGCKYRVKKPVKRNLDEIIKDLANLCHANAEIRGHQKEVLNKITYYKGQLVLEERELQMIVQGIANNDKKIKELAKDWNGELS